MKKPLHPIIAALRESRKLGRISQEAIAAALDKPQNDITRYECGYHSPRLETVCAWANALGYELELRRKDRPTS